MFQRIKIELADIWNRLKNGFFQLLGANVINKAAGMLSNMIVTRLLTQTQYGMWSYVFNIYSYLQLVTGLGLVSGAFQFGAENKGKKEEYQYYKYCLKMGLIFDALLVGAFTVFSLFVQFSIQGSAVYIRLYIPILLFNFIFDILLAVLRSQNRIKEYANILNFNTAFIGLFTCAGSLFGVPGVIAGRYIAAILSLFHIMLKTKKEVASIAKAAFPNRQDKKALWHFSLFNGVSAMLNGLLYLLDVSMIATMIGNSEQVAIYKVATLIPNALVFIPASAIICILPQIVSHNKDKRWLRKTLGKTYLGFGILNLLLCLLLVLFAPLIITVLSGTQYAESIPIFRILVAGYFISGTFRALSTNVLSAMRKVTFNLILSVVSGVCDVILNYFLIIKMGITGAAYATFSVECVTSAMAVIYILYVLFENNKLQLEKNSLE